MAVSNFSINSARGRLPILTIFKAVIWFSKPFTALGENIVFYLNVVQANNGLWHTLMLWILNHNSLRVPNPEDEDYYSFYAFIDPRHDLILQRTTDMAFDTMSDEIAELCLMASKIVYENANAISRVVNQVWEKHFVEFFDCWNDYLQSKNTQAFMFTDKMVDANVVILSFRGTELFDIYDWCTDINLPFYKLSDELGHVHAGFLEALGLCNRKHGETFQRLSNNINQTKYHRQSSGLSMSYTAGPLAYDTIRVKLNSVFEDNPRAKLYVTGHSMGGALAVLFTALRLYEDPEFSSRLGGVLTIGQPRVGDEIFAKFMEERLEDRYFRMVFRTDIFARLPPDDNLWHFKHISPCYHFTSRSNVEKVPEQRYKNLGFSMTEVSTHIAAFFELIQSLWNRIFRKSKYGYTETTLSILTRVLALFFPGLTAHFLSSYVDAFQTKPHFINELSLTRR